MLWAGSILKCERSSLICNLLSNGSRNLGLECHFLRPTHYFDVVPAMIEYSKRIRSCSGQLVGVCVDRFLVPHLVLCI